MNNIKTKVSINAYFAEERVEAHILLASIKNYEAVFYMNHLIQRLPNGYRYDIVQFYKPDHRWRFCKKSLTALVKVETQHIYDEHELSVRASAMLRERALACDESKWCRCVTKCIRRERAQQRTAKINDAAAQSSS